MVILIVIASLFRREQRTIVPRLREQVCAATPWSTSRPVRFCNPSCLLCYGGAPEAST